MVHKNGDLEIFLLLPYCANGTLAELLSSQTAARPLSQTLVIFSQICFAIFAMHHNVNPGPLVRFAAVQFVRAGYRLPLCAVCCLALREGLRMFHCRSRGPRCMFVPMSADLELLVSSQPLTNSTSLPLRTSSERKSRVYMHTLERMDTHTQSVHSVRRYDYEYMCRPTATFVPRTSYCTNLGCGSSATLAAADPSLGCARTRKTACASSASSAAAPRRPTVRPSSSASPQTCPSASRPTYGYRSYMYFGLTVATSLAAPPL